MLSLLTAPVAIQANALPDPTRPYGYDDTPPPVIELTEPRDRMTWNLTGIRISPDDRSAILNGKVVRAGDRIEGARVIEIEADAILIEYRDDRIRIRLLDFDIKQSRQMAEAGPPEREERIEK